MDTVYYWHHYRLEWIEAIDLPAHLGGVKHPARVTARVSQAEKIAELTRAGFHAVRGSRNIGPPEGPPL